MGTVPSQTSSQWWGELLPIPSSFWHHCCLLAADSASNSIVHLTTDHNKPAKMAETVYSKFNNQIKSRHWPDWGSRQQFAACHHQQQCYQQQLTRARSARQNWQTSRGTRDERVLVCYPPTVADWTNPTSGVTLPPATEHIHLHLLFVLNLGAR